MNIYDGSHIDLSDPKTRHKSNVFQCAVEDIITDGRYKCLGETACEIFKVPTICSTCKLDKCENLKLPMGYPGQRIFWSRTPIGRYILANADFDAIPVCCFKNCCHIRKRDAFFCRNHVCRMCSLVAPLVKDYQKWFYHAVGILNMVLPKVVVKYHIAPLLRARTFSRSGKGHVISCADYFFRNGEIRLRGTCLKYACPLKRGECTSKTSKRCNGRTSHFSKCRECSRE